MEKKINDMHVRAWDYIIGLNVKKLSSSGSCIRDVGRLWPLSLLLVAHSSRLRLKLTNIMQVQPHGAGAERVAFSSPAVLLVGGAEPPDQGVQAAPGLAERAGARRRRVRQPEERTRRVVHFRLPELVQVVKEFQHVRPTAHRHRQRRPVVPQILAERVPVSPLLVLVPTRSSTAAAATTTTVGAACYWGWHGFHCKDLMLGDLDFSRILWIVRLTL
ncbi:hypothetical protein V8G54_034573 [Vigna mungo]|uniref:Uncharacterized protein n=1 Tax=Vigna mungo TaxID=3915 RepID=A0AAQ3RKY8_VIGMU